MSQQNWTHDGLAADLAGHLKAPNTMVWTNMQLGPSGSPRPDVYRMNKSFTHPHPLAYECKISRSDFLSDVTSGKWTSYLKYAYGVIFAVPAGLVSPKEMPEKCGLLFRHESIWRAAKRPTIQPCSIPEEAWIKLLIDGVNREGPVNRRRHWNDWASSERFAKKFGAEAARWIHDSCSVKAKVESSDEACRDMYKKAQDQCERIRNEAIKEMPEMWNNLIGILKLEPSANRYQIQSAIGALRREKENSKQKSALRLLDNISHQIDNLRGYIQSDPEPNSGDEEVLPVRPAGEGMEAI
jgi:hypothetical protein